MKKLLHYIVVLICYSGISQNSDYYNRMAYIFENINKTKVTTGYLKEFGIRYNEVEAYNGVISTTNWVDKGQWNSLYTSLSSMRVGTVASGMPLPATVFNNLKLQQAASADVLIASQYYDYQQYKTNAVTNGDVTFSLS